MHILPAGPCAPSRGQVLRIAFHVSIIPNRISRTIITHGITRYIYQHTLHVKVIK